MSKGRGPSVEHYMTRLPRTVAPDAGIEQAHRLMREHRIRHLPVVDGSGALCGIISLGDLHLLESIDGVLARGASVEDAMTTHVYAVAPDEPVDKVAAHMANERLGSSVVVDDGKVSGIFTTTDALIALLHIWKPPA